jgi:RNA polymerase sigma factor (sigma-70 family)
MWSRGPRPSRGELDQAALELVARRGSEILATARRYAATLDDAEDAYQRGLEILLTKAPTADEDDLVPWLKTVVKHEAFALRRQRERQTPTADDGDPPDRPGGAAAAHDQAERYERLRQGAEALKLLKPQEIRALLLKAEGYSYKEICDITGWSYTNEDCSIGPHGDKCCRLYPRVSAKGPVGGILRESASAAGGHSGVGLCE